MTYAHNLITLLIELRVLDANAPVEYSKVDTFQGLRLHLDGAVSSRCNRANGAPERVAGTYNDLADEFKRLCNCHDMNEVMNLFTPAHTREERARVEWLAIHRMHRLRETPSWAAYTITTAPTAVGWPLVDAAVAQEVELAHPAARTRLADPSTIGKRAEVLRQGEGRIEQGMAGAPVGFLTDQTEYVFTADVSVPPAPEDASAADVVAHHDQYRIWALINDFDYGDVVCIFDHVDLTDGRYQLLDHVDVLVSMPVAAAADLHINTNRVIGPDDGHRAADVAATIGLFPDTVPLNDRIAAIHAARL